jgi:hypothetical protein
MSVVLNYILLFFYSVQFFVNGCLRGYYPPLWWISYTWKLEILLEKYFCWAILIFHCLFWLYRIIKKWVACFRYSKRTRAVWEVIIPPCDVDLRKSYICILDCCLIYLSITFCCCMDWMLFVDSNFKERIRCKAIN